MTVTCVVQARTGSTRLPNKVLADVGGLPMLAFQLRRLAPLTRSSGLSLVVATSDQDADDPITALAEDEGVDVFRGSELDVLDRFDAALSAHPADHIVRLTADCPLVDPDVVHIVLDLHQRVRADYTSNTLVRTFPDGMDVEVLTARALRAAAAQATEPVEREHVTPFVYRRPSRFLIAQQTTPEAAGAERWTIDRAEDLAWLRDVVGRLADRAAPWAEILATVGREAPADGLQLRPEAPAEVELGPYQRRWTVLDDRLAVGEAAIEVDDGVGRVRVITPSNRHDDVLRALRAALSADLQVRELLDS